MKIDANAAALQTSSPASQDSPPDVVMDFCENVAQTEYCKNVENQLYHCKNNEDHLHREQHHCKTNAFPFYLKQNHFKLIIFVVP